MTTAQLFMTDMSAPERADSDIIALAQSGDTAAFEQLYRENVGRVYAVCLRMTRDKSQAEDLTQEAFIRAWQKLKSFRGESAFSTWLHRLTVNLTLTHLRSRSRRNEREVLTGDYQAFDKKGRPPVPRERVDLEAAIGALPEGARRVFVLYEIEGYRHQEIADMMGIASGTTKAQLHRARKMLREALTQ